MKCPLATLLAELRVILKEEEEGKKKKKKLSPVCPPVGTSDAAPQVGQRFHITDPRLAGAFSPLRSLKRS